MSSEPFLVSTYYQLLAMFYREMKLPSLFFRIFLSEIRIFPQLLLLALVPENICN